MKKSIHILYIGGSHSIGGDHNPRKLSFLLEVEAPRFLVVLGGLLREVRAGLLREVQGGGGGDVGPRPDSELLLMHQR